jgi:hypothetical protein
MLVDAGHSGFEGRDAGRIIAAARNAALTQIDYLVVTHYHSDHVGGVPQLAERIPIRTFVDHGRTAERGNQAALYKTYLEARNKGAHLQVTTGDRIPVGDLTVQVITSAGALLGVPLKGVGAPNPLCADFEPMKDETGENAHSVGTLVTHSGFRLINLGDLSWNQEYGLVCPTNRVGTVDVLLASQHGHAGAGSPTFVHSIRPRVAVTNNGPKKAVVQPIIRTLRASPGVEDVWQLHQSFLGTQENVDEPFIANVGKADAGHWLKLSARSDGSFTMTNGRTGVTRTYGARK